MTLSEVIRDWFLQSLTERMDQMASALEQIQASVAKMDDTVDSAITAFKAIAEQMQQNAGNEQAIRDLAGDLDARANGLAQAIVASPNNPPA